MDAWAQLACYPQSSFYPLISGRVEYGPSVHYVLLSHLLDMRVLQSSQLVPLHYRHGFHSRLADLNVLLRYLLGGNRPS